MAKIPYSIHKDIVIRVPRYSFGESLIASNVELLFNDDLFLEAIYIASPILYNELDKLKNGLLSRDKKDRVLLSLQKYHSRMFSRCTPFGLFSSCLVAKWGNNGTVLDFTEADVYRHTRLDMNYLSELAHKIAESSHLKRKLIFYPNTSVHALGNEIKYCEYYFNDGARKNKVSAIKNNKYIERILSKAKFGSTLEQLISEFGKDQLNESTVYELLQDMIKSQLLVDELEIEITGVDYLERMISVLRAKPYTSGNDGVADLILVLQKVSDGLKQLDVNKINKVDAYIKIIGHLKTLSVPVNESKIFHVDSYRSSTSATLDEGIRSQLYKSLFLLNAMHSDARNSSSSLDRFKGKFLERYEGKAVSLVEVLDFESGIGYPVDRAASYAPLVSDLFPNHKSDDVNISFKKTSKWMLEVLKEANYEKKYSIELKEDQFDVSEINWDGYPASLSVVFKVVDRKENVLVLDGIIGPSAIQMLGRFANGNSSIFGLVKDIAKIEEDKNPDIIFADLVHQPEARASNVILHPKIRNYEIPYMAKSSLVGNAKIEISDLFIAVKNDEIILFSKKLGKRIIPTKSHMHNHIDNTLPIYHFLGDLYNYTSNSRLINFSWGRLSTLYFFLPRVTFKNVILSAATWNFSIGDFEHLYGLTDSLLFRDIECLRMRYNLPKKVLYVEGDNELLVDFSNILSIKSFLQTIRQKGFVPLKELLWNESSEGAYMNQCIASFVRTNSAYGVHNGLSGIAYENPVSSNVAQFYSIGSEWIYYKIYCSSGSADYVLTNCINSIVENLKEKQLINKWFFVRYADPESHIRLRFHMMDYRKIGDVILLVDSLIRILDANKLIWKVQLDTYTREVDRYGSNSIEVCESIFCIDSDVTLALLGTFHGDKNEIAKWLSGIKGIDDYLTLFGFNLEEKIAFSKTSRYAFFSEFNVSRPMRNRMNVKYKQYKPLIYQVMHSRSDTDLLLNINGLLDEKLLALKSPISIIGDLKRTNKLMVDESSLIRSIIHMMLNRLIGNKERTYEMVLYDFIYKYYLSMRAQQDSF